MEDLITQTTDVIGKGDNLSVHCVVYPNIVNTGKQSDKLHVLINFLTNYTLKYLFGNKELLFE